MTDRDRERFARMMTMLAEAFNQPVSSAKAEVYFSALIDMPISGLEEAAMRHIRTSVYFPKPVELRGGGADVKAIATLAAETAFDTARWEGGGSYIFEDPVITMTIDRLYGGWIQFVEAFNAMTLRDVRFAVEAFARHYEANVGLERPRPKKLIGRFEQHNAGKWDGAVNPPVLVACPWTRALDGIPARPELVAGKDGQPS